MHNYSVVTVLWRSLNQGYSSFCKVFSLSFRELLIYLIMSPFAPHPPAHPLVLNFSIQLTCIIVISFIIFYFVCFPRLWNTLPSFDPKTITSSSLQSLLKWFFWSHFLEHLEFQNLCTFHLMCSSPKCLQSFSTPKFAYDSSWCTCLFS